MSIIYLIESNQNGNITYKIGKTSRIIKNRLKELATGNAGDLNIIHEYQTDIPDKLELAVHSAFSHCRLNGEWFSDELDVSRFMEICELYNKALKIVYKKTPYV
jgi:chemotaxis regulatin CheY-phosphate phosphatase CheZ